ncbi:PREDICTED: uncharacterized protein LOC18586996 [Theobroma cacao]|uniref:Uncharacterized protein LOC18586996 n=1 Tax=Theobroma cacao TaxID=3641 RepID=A0AB32UMK0_THECC|nr:PREDICTED: uncharacterized protein LOC18586996 [Theobroma cacao]
MATNPPTNVQFTNSSDEILYLNAVNIWVGPPQSYIPLKVPVGPTLGVTQQGSVVGIEYKFKDNYSLIVAWINNGVSNKVYAQILPAGTGSQSVQWAQIKESVEKSGNSFDTAYLYGYRCALVIDTVGATPTLGATFSQAT